jgi:hypothetical protein
MGSAWRSPRRIGDRNRGTNMSVHALTPRSLSRPRKSRSHGRCRSGLTPLAQRGHVVPVGRDGLSGGRNRSSHASVRARKVSAPRSRVDVSAIEASRVDPNRVREQNWLHDHGREYPGKWLALFGDLLISQGQSAKEVFGAARERGFDRALIVHVPDENELPFGGW